MMSYPGTQGYDIQIRVEAQEKDNMHFFFQN